MSAMLLMAMMCFTAQVNAQDNKEKPKKECCQKKQHCDKGEKKCCEKKEKANCGQDCKKCTECKSTCSDTACKDCKHKGQCKKNCKK